MICCIYDVIFYAYFVPLDLFPNIKFNIECEFAKPILMKINKKKLYLELKVIE